MKKLMLLISSLLVLVGCETGVPHNGTNNKQFFSVGESSQQKGQSQSWKKLLSKSAQPGYYLQMGVFAKYKPSKTLLKPLDDASLNYTVLNYRDRDYVLIGPYTSYNTAKSKVSMVKQKLKKQTFVVQVLRP